jgi:hypothetical protein
MTLRVPLTQGHYALIDDCDADLVAQRNWCVRNATGVDVLYAQAYFDGVMRGMHRLIMGWPSTEVDHRNGDGLDNRRCNLRLATKSQNSCNRGPNGNVPFKGVYFDRDRQLFAADIRANGVRIRLGRFATAEEAGRAYDQAALELHGEFAWLNFQHPIDRIDVTEQQHLPILTCVPIFKSFKPAPYRQPLLTHCVKGHAYDEVNTYSTPSGRRYCRQCNREAVRRYRTRRFS